MFVLSIGVADVGNDPAVHVGVHVADAVGQVAHHRWGFLQIHIHSRPLSSDVNSLNSVPLELYILTHLQ